MTSIYISETWANGQKIKECLHCALVSFSLLVYFLWLVYIQLPSYKNGHGQTRKWTSPFTKYGGEMIKNNNM